MNRLPRATYRVQLRPGFGFEEARQLIDWLGRWGISDLYLSPLFQARAGSEHGYDVVDHTRIEPAFGGRAGFERLAREAREAGLGVLLDIVPNHMGINDPDNGLWNDVLENGPAARSASAFDIDWHPPTQLPRPCVLLPFLGRPFGETLESGELAIEYQAGRWSLRYFERRFPLAPTSWIPLLRGAADALTAETSSASRHELESIVTQLRHLPSADQIDAAATAERYREQNIARRRLAALVEGDRSVAASLAAAIKQFNGEPGQPRSFDKLAALLQQQHYRLAYWRVAVDEINYRRFFDINDLVAVRVEQPEVFERTHQLVFELIQAGLVTGLRVDHPDGLLDPAEYFRQLQVRYRAPGDATDDAATQLYVVAEKILTGEEHLRGDWAVKGTTGYAFLNQLSSVLVDVDGVQRLQALYAELVADDTPPRDVIYQSKLAILQEAMASDLFVLASQLFRLARADRRTQDWTLPVLLRALREVIACFPVYRAYTRPVGWDVAAEDQRRIQEAIRWAKRRNPTMPRGAFDFVAAVLLLRFPPELSAELQADWRSFAVRTQQVTAPVTAKGVEDTAFYRYYPLTALNEVGGELGGTGLPVEQFHRQMRHRQQEWPGALSATTTHDTKRGEDLRARLLVLSEIPEEYAIAFQSWDEATQELTTSLNDEAVPDRNERYLIHQTLLGTWPVGDVAENFWETYPSRIAGYLEKAFREAKRRTSWLNPDADFETAVQTFASRVLADRQAPAAQLLDRFAKRIASYGYLNGLAQVVLKCTLPGVPDFYQGCEYWDFRLVDPDNRGPVDFSTRVATLQMLEAGVAVDALSLLERLRSDWTNALKQFVTWRAADVRRREASLFATADYHPLEVTGAVAESVLALARRLPDRTCVVVVPRLTTRVVPWSAGAELLPPSAFTGRVWGDTTVHLPDASPFDFDDQINLCTVSAREGGLRVSELFSQLPVSLLVSRRSFS